MMPNIVKGGRMAGLMVYLCGPGRANEHTEPHLVAADTFLMSWHDDAELNRDSALAIAAYLDKPRRAFGTEVTAPARNAAGEVIGRKPAHVWHCSLALEPGEGPLGDERWQAIATDFMDGMGFSAAGSGRSPARWAGVHHGLTKAGGDHIHIAASLVREDGTKVSTHNDHVRAQKLCTELERKHGLRVLVSRELGTTMPGVKPAEAERAARLGLPEPERHTVARTVRAAAAAASTEAEFVRMARREGLLLRARFADGRSDVVVGYSAALRPRAGERPLYYSGSGLAKDLALPRLREKWTSTPELAAEAVSEWTAAKRGHRTVKGGRRGPRRVSVRTLEQQAEKVADLRAQLRAVPVDDRHTWAVVAQQTAGVFAAWSRRTEARPGPLAATADALARSAQIQYRLPRPKYTPAPALSGSALLVLTATGRRSPAADMVMLRQLANTMKAIHDAHVARGELKQALVLESAARGQLGQLMATLPAVAPSAAGGVQPDRAGTAMPTGLERTERTVQSAPGNQVIAAETVAAAVGTPVAEEWSSDPAWPALEARIEQLADDGLDAVATVRAAYDWRPFTTAQSDVQVMTWRLAMFVTEGKAIPAGGALDSDEQASLDTLRAASAAGSEAAVSSPLPNRLDEPANRDRPLPGAAPAGRGGTDNEIGD